MGIIQPLTLRSVGDNAYQIISGERRFRAAKLAGLDSVPAYVRTADDEKVLFDFMADLFNDDDRGVERIYGVIDFTIWGNDRRPSDWKPEDASWQIKFD